ncbi:MAG: hypothetical protein KAG56_10975, partial [Sulfurovaceae bacterium]|nr:hypothetical protein [Sulfurovaceae bacterium]
VIDSKYIKYNIKGSEVKVKTKITNNTLTSKFEYDFTLPQTYLSIVDKDSHESIKAHVEIEKMFPWVIYSFPMSNGGKEINGKTKLYLLPQKRYKIIVNAEGYKTSTKTVRISGKSVNDIEILMTKGNDDLTAVLTVDTNNITEDSIVKFDGSKSLGAVSYEWKTRGRVIQNQTSSSLILSSLSKGNHTITLIVFDSDGNRDETSITIEVTDPLTLVDNPFGVDSRPTPIPIPTPTATARPTAMPTPTPRPTYTITVMNPSIVSLEIEKQSDSIKIKAYYISNDGSAIDFSYLKITNPIGKTYTYKYDNEPNYKEGWVTFSRNYKDYE